MTGTISRSLSSLLILLSISTGAAGAEARIGELLLDVPFHFKGPLSSKIAKNVTTVGYATADGSGKSGSVLQVTRLQAEGPAPAMSDAEATRMTSRYVLEMLAGIERRRTDFARSSPQEIRLGGLIASKVTWTGKLDGMPTNGAMYCVFVGPELVTLHAFGTGNSTEPSTSQAISAIEALRIAPANNSPE